jgi:hypothetical protein
MSHFRFDSTFIAIAAIILALAIAALRASGRTIFECNLCGRTFRSARKRAEHCLLRHDAA